MFDFEGLPDWQKEAVLIGEVLCGFYSIKPKASYKNPLDRQIRGLVNKVGSASDLKKEAATIRKILRLTPQIRSDVVLSRDRFMKECTIILKANESFFKANTRRGPKSASGNFEYWFLAVIAESIRNKPLENALFEFIKTGGTFQNWHKWRFGGQKQPYYFPAVASQGNRGDFKHWIRDNVFSSMQGSLKRRKPTLSLEKINASIELEVSTYKKILFRRADADEVELGIYSYLHQLRGQ